MSVEQSARVRSVLDGPVAPGKFVCDLCEGTGRFKVDPNVVCAACRGSGWQPKRYSTIVVDPPWDHADGTGTTITVGSTTVRHPDPRDTTVPYSVMGLDEIKALPVNRLARRDAHLYLWTTNRYLRHVWDVAEAWGFEGVCIITWCKPWRGWLGGGAWPSNTEFCLFARRGDLKAIGKARGRWYEWARRSGPPTALGERRSSMHSAKPEAFLDYVEQVSPGPYVELFARRARFGWDYWGNESLGTAEVAA